MSDDEPTQETRPKKGKPVKIPVPDKADVLAAFRKGREGGRRRT